MNKSHEDDLHPEYDFASMKGGVRGKYVRRFRAGTNLVLLEANIAKAFPTDAAVNEALRAGCSTRRMLCVEREGCLTRHFSRRFAKDAQTAGAAILLGRLATERER